MIVYAKNDVLFIPLGFIGNCAGIDRCFRFSKCGNAERKGDRFLGA